MSVVNGQKVNAAVTNAAFVSKTTDSTTVGKLTLNKAAEGTQVDSVQKAVNKIYEGLGTTGQNDATINDYANNNFITDGDSRKVAIEKLDAQAAISDSEISGIDTRVTDIESGVSTFSGNKTFNDNVIIQGNLTVNGTTTTVNSATLEVTDANVLVNNGGNDATSEGAGLTVERTGTSGSIAYQNSLASKFKVGDLGSEQQIVTVGHTQTLVNKFLTDPVFTASGVFTEITTPSTPSAGFRKIYSKSDGFYQLDSAGLETAIGGGGSGANATLSNLTSPTSINQNLRPNSILRRIGDSGGFAWGRAYVNQIYDSADLLSYDSTTRTIFDGVFGSAAEFNGDELKLNPNSLTQSRAIKWLPPLGVGSFSLKPANNIPSNIVMTLPNTAGVAGDYLTNTGSGVTAWKSIVRAMVSQSTGQSIPNNTDTTVICNNVLADPSGIYSTATGQFTLPRSGFGTIKATLVTAFTGTGAFTMYAAVFKNGSLYKSLSYKLFDTTVAGNFSFVDGGSCDFEGVSGDVFTVVAFQNSGAARSLSTNSDRVFTDFILY